MKSNRQKDPELEQKCTKLPGHSLEVSYFIETDSLNYESCQIDAIPDGETRTYYENGAPRSIGSYSRGVLTGAWTRWHPSGNKMDEGEWDKGHPVGNWKSYYANGLPKEVFKYTDSGDRCTLKAWSEKGSVKVITHPCKAELRQASLAHFTLNALSIFQGHSGQYNTAELSWTPEIGVGPKLSIHGILGGFILYYQNTQSHNLGLEGAGLLQFQNSPRMSLALGPGLAVISDTSQTKALELLSEISYYNKPGNWIDRIFIGVSKVVHVSTAPSSNFSDILELRLGISI